MEKWQAQESSLYPWCDPGPQSLLSQLDPACLLLKAPESRAPAQFTRVVPHREAVLPPTQEILDNVWRHY